MQTLPHRLIEVAAMLPILHVPPGPITVATVGTHADLWAAEALRWRDVRTLYTLQGTRLMDGRVQAVGQLPERSINVLLLSPEQCPKPWLQVLAPNGVVSALTATPGKVRPLRAGLSHDLGNATPWRDWLPSPIYGVLAKSGIGKVERLRQPPAASKHLSRQYLPCLFTFAKDELPVIFGGRD